MDDVTPHDPRARLLAARRSRSRWRRRHRLYPWLAVLGLVVALGLLEGLLR